MGCEPGVVYTYIFVIYTERAGLYVKLKHTELHLYNIIEECVLESNRDRS